ncbi:MAG: hypothetical protein J0H08_04255 [Rhizobiales bacterium]|nr:hypothetical protein [Hyphomicrobiales bacterium]
MLTTAADQVDVGAAFTGAELARLKDVSRQAINKRWRRMEAEGLIHPTVGADGAARVSLAEWDMATGESTDPAKLLGAETAKVADGPDREPTQPAGNAKYNQERARLARYDADKREIELRKLKGELVEVAAVADAMTRCAEAIVRDLDRLPALAEDFADVVARGGAPGLREQLKRVVREIRDTLARSMSLLGNTADADPEDA